MCFFKNNKTILKIPKEIIDKFKPTLVNLVKIILKITKPLLSVSTQAVNKSPCNVSIDITLQFLKLIFKAIEV